jgi:CRP-like cAMP-binding protein
MFPTDPASVRQIRHGDLLAAEQYRLRHQSVQTPSTMRRILAAFSGRDATTFDPSLELFVGLDRRSLGRLAKHFSVVDLTDRDSLARQGEPSSEFVIVLDGRIGVSLDGLPLAVLDPGSHFGALPLLDGGPGRLSRASFFVMEPTRVAIANRHQFFRIMDDFPIVGRRIVRMAEIHRAYLRGHADATSLAADREMHPFPVHLVEQV